MHDNIYLKLKRQQCMYKPNSPSYNLCNILNKNDNIHRYGANKRQLEGQLQYITQIY